MNLNKLLINAATKSHTLLCVMQSSHVNLHRISTANAFLRESQQTKSSGLNLWVGRVLCHLLLLLLLHWMFAASFMKFGHGTCFLSVPNL